MLDEAPAAVLSQGSPERLQVISASVLCADGARGLRRWVGVTPGLLECSKSSVRYVCSSLEGPWAQSRGFQVMWFGFKEDLRV